MTPVSVEIWIEFQRLAAVSIGLHLVAKLAMGNAAVEIGLGHSRLQANGFAEVDHRLFETILA